MYNVLPSGLLPCDAQLDADVPALVDHLQRPVRELLTIDLSEYKHIYIYIYIYVYMDMNLSEYYLYIYIYMYIHTST